MLKVLVDEPDENTEDHDEGGSKGHWLKEYFQDFRRRFISLLSYQFRDFTPQTALSILQQKGFKEDPQCKRNACHS